MTATITEPVLGRAFRKARAVMTGNGKEREAKKLADALSELQKLEARRLAIVAFNDSLIEELNRVCEPCRDALKAYEGAKENGDITAVRELLGGLPGATAMVEFARKEIELIRSSRSYGAEFAAFQSEFPHAMRKTVLAKVCTARLRVAQDRAAAVLVEARAEYAGEDVDEEDITNLPRVRKANSAVKTLEAMLHGIETGPVESPFDGTSGAGREWQTLVIALLSP
jgi:hypothetical protein